MRAPHGIVSRYVYNYKQTSTWRAFFARTSKTSYLAKACFPPGRICSREQRKKQRDWLATNTDVITTQSHPLFPCSREKYRQLSGKRA
jgi:hypothetical protein